MDDLTAWFAGRLPDDWFDAFEVRADREEIVVTGTLTDVDLGSDAGDGALAEARTGRITRFREQTRPARIKIAREAERRFRRKVAWGARCGDVEVAFTRLAVPVMTRLRFDERAVLDTLIDAGVARSRSHALAWCVRLVGRHEADWIERLRDALTAVEEARAEGPVSA